MRSSLDKIITIVLKNINTRNYKINKLLRTHVFKGWGGRACENKFSLRKPLRKKEKKIHLFLNIKYLILQHKYLPHDLRDVW